MGPKLRECFYLGPVRNHSGESNRVFVHTRKTIKVVTRNAIWDHVCSGRSSTAQSKSSMEGRVKESGQDQESSAADSESVSEDGESRVRGNCY